MSTPAPTEPVSQTPDSDTPAQSRIVGDTPEARTGEMNMFHSHTWEYHTNFKLCTGCPKVVSAPKVEAS